PRGQWPRQTLAFSHSSRPAGRGADPNRRAPARHRSDHGVPRSGRLGRQRSHGPSRLDPVGRAGRALPLRHPFHSSSDERQLAADFLKTLLHDGPKPRDAVLQAGAAQGFSSRTLDRARNLARIHSRTVWIDKKPVTFWRLPRQLLPPTATLGPPDLEPYLAPL